MDIKITAILIICVLACLAWYVNAALNTVPVLNKLVSVLIVVVSVILLLQACGLMGGGTHIHVS